MTSFVVMESPDKGDAVYVRDRFHVLAFLLAPLWLLWNRLWIEALLVVAVMGVIGAGSAALGMPQIGSWLSLLVSLFVGLEGPALRINALRRRGWHETGVVIAENAAEAEIRHMHGMNVSEPVATLPAVPMPQVAANNPPRLGQSGPALGLFSYPGPR